MVIDKDNFGERLTVVSVRLGGWANTADAAGVTRETLRLWRLRKVDPRMSALQELADKADVSLDWLVNGEAPQRQSVVDLAESLGLSELMHDFIRDKFGAETVDDLEEDQVAVVWRSLIHYCRQISGKEE